MIVEVWGRGNLVVDVGRGRGRRKRRKLRDTHGFDDNVIAMSDVEVYSCWKSIWNVYGVGRH